MILISSTASAAVRDELQNDVGTAYMHDSVIE
jgi:hypothetical protein